MKIEVNKIITLGNKEKYLVIDKVVKDGKTLIDEVLGEDNLKTLLPLFVEKNKES